MLLAALFSHATSGLFAVGGLSGLLDVDPVILSMAEMVRKNLDPAIAAGTILVAAASNSFAKVALGAIFGGWKLGRALGAMALLSTGAGALTYFLAG